MRIRRYENYIESGADWLGEVPATWRLGRLGSHFDARRETVSDKDFPALSVTRNGIVPQLKTAAKSDDGDNRKKVVAGDFVINGRSDRRGSSGLATQDGSVSLINLVLTPRDIDPAFVHHLFRSYPFQEEFYRFGKGIVADLWSTNFSEMKGITIPLPPVEEQAAIARFLDRETSSVDTLIAKQQRLIELLQEKRQALITRAVTRGLDLTVPLKDSGAEWLREVPEHWKVIRIKHVIRSIEQGWSPECESRPAEDGEWGVLKVGCVNGGMFNAEENKALPLALDPNPSLSLRRGDVLVSRANTRDLVGSCAVVTTDHPQLMLCDKLYRLVATDHVAPSYLAWMITVFGRREVESAATGASASMVNVGQGVVTNLLAPLPPVREQKAILGFLGSQLSVLRDLNEKAEKAIELAREHRAALISAAVTGKIDIRESAGAASGKSAERQAA